jgi:aryl-alcohol dehydrogenase-like predicted oxidoreductase
MAYGVANRTGRPSPDEVAAILEVARRAGIDTLDTARAYGESERVIGELTQGDPHWKIVTKLDPAVVGPEDDLDASLERVEESLARSREALRRGRIDLLLLHRSQHRTAWDGALWELLCHKRAAGEIAALGVSAGSPREAWALMEDPTLDALQVAANLLDQRLVRGGFFGRASARGKQVFVRSVFLQGLAHLEVEALPSHLADLGGPLATLEGWTQERGLRRSDAFLLYARRLPSARVVLGCETAGQLCQNLIAWRSLDLPREEVAELAGQVGEIDEDLLDPARWGELEAALGA